MKKNVEGMEQPAIDPLRLGQYSFSVPSMVLNPQITVDDRTEPKILKFWCFGNFGLVRFGSVRLEKTEPKQISEFRFKKYTVGQKIEKKSSLKSFSLSLL